MTPDIVHVACKLPSGLRLHGKLDAADGARDAIDAAVTERSGDQVVIRGTAHDRGGSGQPPELYGGYAVTVNVPADLWEAWLRDNAESAMVRNRLVFADADLASLKARAAARASVRTGLEPR